MSDPDFKGASQEEMYEELALLAEESDLSEEEFIGMYNQALSETYMPQQFRQYADDLRDNMEGE